MDAAAPCEGMNMQYDEEIDVKGLSCPLPILRAKKALAQMESGKVLKVVATDSGSAQDFPLFARQTGHELLAHSEADGVYTFLLKRR